MQKIRKAGQPIAEAAGRRFIEYRTGAGMRYNREQLREDWFFGELRG